MKPIFIGISGGSGAGKSTLCTSLLNKYPDQIGLIQLDDYFKKAEFVPEYNNFKNWDHPDALRLDQLHQDLLDLQEEKTVKIWTKNERLNPDYKKTDKRIEVEFEPKPIMLIEGYLVLHDPRIRELFETSIWLDIDQEESWKRRVHFKKDGYLENVLLPMNKQFVQPAKKYAEHLIDVTSMSKDEVFEQVQDILKL
jgi:uridine kinase